MSGTNPIDARCGFFNSPNGYSADDLCMPYKRILSNGVYASENGDESQDLNNLNLNLSNAENLVYDFQEGIYSVSEFRFSGCNNITILAPNATLQHSNTSVNPILQFENCTNCRIIGGIYDGNDNLSCGISIINSQNTIINDIEIKNISNSNIATANGISFEGNCSKSLIKNIVIHDICNSAGNSIIASGISLNANNDNIISKNVVIENAHIYNIGNDSSNNGTAIYINQPPKFIPNVDNPDVGTIYDNESFITIVNPEISACTKRAINVSAFCVDIIGGVINVSSNEAAIEYLCPRNSTIRNAYVSNSNTNNKAALAFNGGDGIISVENCYFSGTNGKGNGIHLYGNNAVSFSKYNGGENIKITNCDFENLFIPIIADSVNGVNCDSITIRDCTIGHFKGSSAIRLLPNRFSSIKKLKIRDIMFKFGTNEATITKQNNTFYSGTSQTQSLIYLGTTSNYLDPSHSLFIDLSALEEDYNEKLIQYGFHAKNVFLGGAPALASQVYEFPNQIEITNGTYQGSIIGSNGEPEIKATVVDSDVANEKNIVVSTTVDTPSAQNLFIQLASNFIVTANVDYIIEVNSNKINSNLSIGLYSGIKGVARVGSEILLNAKTKKSSLRLNNSATATKLWIKLKTNVAVPEISITFTVKPKNPLIKGMADLDSRIKKLENKINEPTITSN